MGGGMARAAGGVCGGDGSHGWHDSWVLLGSGFGCWRHPKVGIRWWGMAASHRRQVGASHPPRSPHAGRGDICVLGRGIGLPSGMLVPSPGHPPPLQWCPLRHSHLLTTTPNLSTPRQDDPSAPHKPQDSLKSCLKDEEPFNIHNSTSPKHDGGGKGEQEGGELNCLQNNLT